jgi:phenylacetic acid degradation operon negative regulatory protein
VDDARGPGPEPEDDDRQPGPAGTGAASLRPQSLMLTFLGNYVLGQDLCVYSGSVIDVFARTGVGEHAARSTLARMVNRDLLRRQRHGRKMYFGLTARSEQILRDGEERIWRAGAVNRDWDGTWTLLGFSLPEAWQSKRHDLRSQLAWAGFGPLLGGLWIAPGRAEVAGLVASLGLESHVKVFRSTAEPGTDVQAMVRDTWDLDALAARYDAFTARWRHLVAEGEDADPLGVKLRLFTEWLQIVRADPRLPVQHLPAQWPAAAAQELFHAANDRLDRPARQMAERLLDTVPAKPDD